MSFELPPGVDFTITVSDIVRAGHCARGARRFFTEKGFDAREVFRNGISARELLSTGDGNAEQVVQRTWEARRGEA